MKITFGVFLLASSLAFCFFQSAPTPSIQPLEIERRPEEILVVNMIPHDQSGEHNQDSEPFLAVSIDKQNWQQSLMIGTAFKGKFQERGAPPLVLSSTDWGWTWKSTPILNEKQVGSHTYCFSGKKNNFYGAVLTIEGENQSVSVVHTSDPSTEVPMVDISNLSSGREFSDAPFIQAHAFGEVPKSSDEEDKRVDNIYVGQNYFGFSGEQSTRTASIRVSNDDGKNFTQIGLEARDTGNAGQDGPVIRPAVADDGTVYVAFLHWSGREGNKLRGDVVVSRDDKAGAGKTAFQALVDPSDGLPGRMVTRDRLFSGSDKLGQQLIIAPLSLAVSPADSATVYVAWVDYDLTTKSHVLHVKKSTDKGQYWSEDIRTISSATNPALAVSADGVIGLLYQQLADSEPKGSKQWETHFQSSVDGGSTWTNRLPLAAFPTEIEPKSESEFGPYLGFRSHLLAVGSSFFGIFSAPNIPEKKYFPQGFRFQRETSVLLPASRTRVKPSIDPYFFRINRVAIGPKVVGLGNGTMINNQGSSGWTVWALGAISVTPFLVSAALIVTVMALLAARHAKHEALKTSDQIRKTSAAIHGPPLINYKGFVSIRFTDAVGDPIERPNTKSHLIVTFADTAQGNKFEEPINLQGGEDAPEVVFTVVIDSIDFEVDPEHKMVSVPVTGSREVAFNLLALDNEEQSLFVQVFQNTQLVQVVAHTLVSQTGQSS